MLDKKVYQIIVAPVIRDFLAELLEFKNILCKEIFIVRKYSLDAIRHIKSIPLLYTSANEKQLTHYNDLLTVIYDSCILLCEEVYHTDRYPAIADHNLKTLVEAIAYKHFDMLDKCAGYDRLYHVYELVYGGHKYACFDDVKHAVDTLNAILNVYVNEVNVKDLEFACAYYDVKYTKGAMKESLKYKKYLMSQLGIEKVVLS